MKIEGVITAMISECPFKPDTNFKMLNTILWYDSTHTQPYCLTHGLNTEEVLLYQGRVLHKVKFSHASMESHTPVCQQPRRM